MKMKAWIIYGGSPGWWDASLVLENGWVPFGHVCSHPDFMKGDLLLGRTERLAVFDKMGVEIEIVGEPIAGSDNPGIPEGLIEKFKNKDSWKDFAEEYSRTKDELFPEIEEQAQ